MRVIFVTSVYPNNFGKADGIFVHEQAKMMQGKGCQVDILYIDLRSIRKKRKWGKIQEEYEGLRIFHYSIPCGPIPVIHDLLYLQVQKFALYDYVRTVGTPDVIHGHFYINGFFAEKMKAKYKVRYLLTEHSSELYSQRISFLHRYIMRKSYNGADHVIAVSKALKKRMERYTVRNIQVIPNIISDQFYYDERKKNVFRFLCVGHLVENKGMRILLEAFNELQQQIKDISLILVGDGILKKELEEYAEDKQLNVVFMGEMEHKCLPAIYRECQCFVLPSKMETFGISYIEALASGIPVIATKCGGPEEFVNSSNGKLISVGNKTELYEAMRDIHNNIQHYSGKDISEKTLREYGKAGVGQTLLNLYLEMT